MNLPFLTQQGGILGPFSWIMGKILNGIYEFLSIFGVHNIAICIIIFTFVIKMLMLPLTIKQQKYSRLSSKMNPELTKINAKYKGKNLRDPAVAKKQQAETQEVYAKYGASPLSGCLPLLVTLPIMIALYRVIYIVPAYVNDFREMYEVIAQRVVEDVKGYHEVFVSENLVGTVKNFVDQDVTHLIDVFSSWNADKWNQFFDMSQFSAIKDVFVQLNGTQILVSEVVEKIIQVNSFILGMNILNNAGWMLPGILIPLISTGLYFLQNKLMATSNAAVNNVDNPAAQSMKTMTMIMPVISGLFCVFMPIGVGIYWISSSLFQIIQQVFINRYLDKVGIDELIEKSNEKSSKRKQKYGIDTGSKMASVAKASTRMLDEQENMAASGKKKAVETASYKNSGISYSAGSISANAHILSNKNRDKGDKENNG